MTYIILCDNIADNMSNKKPISIKDIAEKAGVGVSTVSRTLNSPHLVKKETKEKVFSVIRECGYIYFRRKKTETNYIIGLAVPNTKINFIAELVRAIEDELMNTPYDLILFNMRMKRKISRYFRENITLRKKVDALIIFSASMDDESVYYFRALNIPVVLLQTRCEREKSISTNNYQGAFDAVKFLIERGYKKIGFIGWTPEDEHLTDRFHGYKNAIEKFRLNYSKELADFSTLSVKGGYEATSRLFERSSPEAIFYACDSMAYGGYQYFIKNGLKIPEDIGIVGFDDLEFSSVIGLTTMRQYIRVKVKLAISYLLDRLSGKIQTPSQEEISITPKLIVRSSTR